MAADNQLTIDQVDTVIYHSPCSDGTGAALAVYMYMREHHPDREVTYIPGVHGSKPPCVTGKHVLLCDFTYRIEHMKKMISEAANLLIIDHHKTAMEDLKDLDPKYKHFNLTRSGAALTWMWAFPDRPLPKLIEYIEDRDLWVRKLPLSNEFGAWFYNDVPLELEVYRPYLDDDHLMSDIQTHGPSFLRLNNRYVEQAAARAVPMFLKIDRRYYLTVHVNSTILKSEIAEHLLNDPIGFDFVVVYSIDDKKQETHFSLRSRDDRADVGTIAFQLGGGGHRNASGVVTKKIRSTLPGVTIPYSDRIHDIISKVVPETIAVGDRSYKVIRLDVAFDDLFIGDFLVHRYGVDVVYNYGIIQTFIFHPDMSKDGITKLSSELYVDRKTL